MIEAIMEQAGDKFVEDPLYGSGVCVSSWIVKIDQWYLTIYHNSYLIIFILIL